MLQHYNNSVKKLYMYLKQITKLTYPNDHDSVVMRFLCFI